MAQLFPKWTNRIPLFGALVAPVAAVLAVGFVWYYFSPEYTDVGYMPEQPVPYSHKLHAGELGIDCRYCHSSVEQSAVSNVPPTAVCMNCHSLVQRDSPKLAAIRESYETGRPMRWVRVHSLPDYAYFNHSVHVNAGVGCVSCHGDIQNMEVVYQAEPLSMGWCLDCHRNPYPNIRPRDQVTNMNWIPSKDFLAQVEEMRGNEALNPPEDCTGCHR